MMRRHPFARLFRPRVHAPISHREAKIAVALVVAGALLGWSPAAQAQFCPGNLVSNASFELHTGATNSTGDPIPTVWVVESGEDGATAAFQPPTDHRIGYVWGTPTATRAA
jgi:hypothetical protein